MAQANIGWTPGGGANSTGQRVEYKLASSATWTVHSTVAANVSSASITGLADNTIYDFRIGNVCNDAAQPSYQAVIQKVMITCPSVTPSVTSTTIAISFAHLGANVTKYTIDLLNGAGTSVLQTRDKVAPFASTITDSFTGLSPSTSYQIRITVFAGLGTATNYSRVCTASSVSTAAPSACNAPTNVVVTMS